MMYKKIITIAFLFLLSAFFHLFTLSKQVHFPSIYLNQKIDLLARVDDISFKDAEMSSYLVTSVKICDKTRCFPIARKMKLAIYQRMAFLHPGYVYWFRVKIKRVHGYHDPGIRQSELLAFVKGVNFIATSDSKILPHPASLRTEINHTKMGDFFTHLRYRLSQKIMMLMPWDQDRQGILQGLILGNKAFMSSQLKKILQLTGTSHLLAISGLHIGMMAKVASLLIGWCWRLCPRYCLILPAQKMGALCGLGFSLFYVILSGAETPAIRAFCILCFFSFALLTHRYYELRTVFIYSVILGMLIQPFAFLEVSFWLSYGAVFLILYLTSHRQEMKRFLSYFKIQLGIMIGLMPFLFYFFQQTSRVSFFSNLVAIPLVTFFILPLGFIACFFPAAVVSRVLFKIEDNAICFLIWFLKQIAGLPHALLFHGLPHLWILIISLVACLLLFAPKQLGIFWLGGFYLLPFIFYKPTHLPSGAFQAEVLDVGQGLSVVIETRHHALVYDLGPKFPNGNSATIQVVVPYLRYEGIDKIDKLIISHQDSDHLGDWLGFVTAIKTDEIISSAPQKFTNAPASFKLPNHACQSGQFWRWDGVLFQVLFPFSEPLQGSNSESCVLKISTASSSLLIPGDIERSAEVKLIHQNKDALPATALILPHHGSKTSSTAAFIEIVHPTVGIVSSGWLNRYHFPHASVVNRLRYQGIPLWNTSDCGAIRLVFTKDKHP